MLTSIGETLVEGTSRSTSRQDSVDLFREAVLLFAKCLAIQEKLYSNELTQAAELEGYTENTNPPPNNDTNATVNSPPSPIGEEWALIVEPITPSALLDTCLAQMQTLGSLIPLLPSDKSTVAEIENLAIPLLSKAESFASAAPPADQTPTNHLLARFNLLVAIADLSFRSSLMTIGQYADVLASTFADSPTLSDSANGLCDFADATFTFNASASQSQDVTSTGPLRWECLTKALQGLSKAVKVPDATNKAGMHSRKGDMELLRARLADPPLAYHVAASSRDTLLGNAETFYRGAKYVAAAEEDEQARIEMSVKEAIVKKVRGDSGALNSMLAENVGKVQEVMEGMMEDGLIIP